MAKNNLTIRKGKCMNFGNCNKANTKEIIEVNIGEDFICPECEGPLIDILGKKPFPVWIIIVIAIILVLCGGVYFGYPFVKGLFDKKKPIEEEHIVPVEDITLDITSLSFVNIGASMRLAATVHPINVADKNKKVIWQSIDTSIATVDENGIVTSMASGSTLISAYTGNGLSATCYVEVANVSASNAPKPATQQPVNQTSRIIEKTYSFGKYKGDAVNGYPEGDGTMTYNRRVQIAKHDTNASPRFAESGDYFIGSWGNGDIVSGILYDKNGNIKERIIAPKRFNQYDISKD